jgi:hypothetical protein
MNGLPMIGRNITANFERKSMKRKIYLVLAQAIFLFTILFSCSPKLRPFLIINQNVNTKEHTFLNDERNLSYKVSAGYRIHYRQIRVVTRIEFKNYSDELFTLDVRRIRFASTNYNYKIDYISSQHGSLKEAYGIERAKEYDSMNPILETKPGKKGWLYISAETDAPIIQDRTLMAGDEKMTLILGDGNLGAKEVKFEEIQFATEFSIKGKR